MSPKRIVVLLGTDHHPFDRLVGWADAHAERHPESDVLVQHGHSSAPSIARGVAFLTPDDLQRTVATADVVITHGGPATITDARSGGKRPIVLPRDPARGEHVDEHQLRFAAWISGKDLVSVAGGCADMDRIVGRELQHPSVVRPQGSSGYTASERLAEVLGGTPQQAAPSVPVIFIAGAGRSGSTILERVLGQDTRIVSLGEVHHLWDRGIVKNELCGCGEPFRDCQFWAAVGDRAFGGWQHVDLDRVGQLADAVDRQRRILKTAAPWMTPAMTTATEAYTDYFLRIYQAALHVSGAEIVVDSTKHPSLAMALSHNRRIDLRVLHLVRDGLGVSYSWSKTVSRPEARSTDDAEMIRYSAARSSAYWLATNLESELLRLRGKSIVRMRYEQFVQAPQPEIERLWRSLGLQGAPPQLVDKHGSVTLERTHTVAGNPARFTEGVTSLRPDQAWMTNMPRRERWQVATMTAPMRAFYGYRRIK